MQGEFQSWIISLFTIPPTNVPFTEPDKSNSYPPTLFKISSNVISHLYQLHKVTAVFVLQPILYEFLTFPKLETIKKGPFNAKLLI